ncbi:MAG: pimeloyl-CoA dehydrogenase small subunit [Burkholderiales bacterium]|nr:MAG: pimeloyl-CoA dehydrogenase small subunit [Burkholderiales bacterium]
MDFQYSQEQQQLADAVGRLFEKSYDFEARKRIVGSVDGWSPDAWAAMAEMGLLMIPFAADDGGFGGGVTDLIATMEAIGAALVVEPFASTLLGGRLVANACSAAQREALLPGVIDGSTKLAFAHAERASRYALNQVETKAVKAAKGDGGWRLDGEKVVVLHAPMADRLIVSARTSGEATDAGGISLFVVDPKAAGVTTKTYRTVDNLRAADIAFAGATLPADALLGEPGAAFDAIDEAVDFATVLACCEAVGAMKFANEATLEYLKTRKQFGVPIGAFQALQHRMVDMTISAEQARSICLLACAKLDAAARGEIEAAERRRVVSAAKVKTADACRHVGQEAIQLHGGMGMTQEMKVAHTFKRLTMIAQQYGDVDHHLERFAASW